MKNGSFNVWNNNCLIDDLTVEQVLDIPFWSHEPQEAKFSSLRQFEDFYISCENILQHELQSYDYNTFNAFIQFYQNYKKAKKSNKSISLINFISDYKTRICKESLSCVGLSLSLIKKLRQTNPLYARSIALVSCEEAVKDTGAYSMESPNNVKEHVLVCIRINIDKKRSGFVLLDPGYHVSRPIIVMNDGLYPHTSWFLQSSNPKVVKEYCYQVIDDQFIAWKVKETRNGCLDEWENLIYVKRAFIKCLTITEKRSLIFSLKSLVVRNRKGPIAGVYCWIESKSLTLFYEDNGKRVQEKIAIDQIGSSRVNETLKRIVQFMNTNEDINDRTKNLHQMLIAFKDAINDTEFMPQLCEIDKWIETE